VEIVVRAYLTGSTKTSAWVNYSSGVRDFCGNKLPEGMVKNQPFKDLILTQTILKDLDFLLPEKALVQGLETPFDYGLVLLDTTLTPSLEQEGYTRELIRRIQSLRKEANLQKKDKITLYIQTRCDLGSWIKTLKKKVGAKKLIIRTRAPRMAFEKTIAATLRDNTFTLYLSKLSL